MMKTILIPCAVMSCVIVHVARADQAVAERWLAESGLAPPFVVPASLPAWEVKRQEVRSELWNLLGRLPPRPKTPRVEVLWRQDRGDFVVEKFQFDNEAGSMVPGYLLLPKNVAARHPAILDCHGTVGNTRSGKRSCFKPSILQRHRGRRL